MKTVNSVERKRVTKRFAGFYAISVGLLGLIFAALTFGKQSGSSTGASLSLPVASNTSLAEQEQILSASAPLQAAFQKLQEYDEQYAALLTQPNAAAKLDALRVSISNAESQINKGIDALNKSKSNFREGASSRIVERIANTYSFALSSRDNLENIRTAMASGSKLEPGQQEVLKLSSELSVKDKRITELEKMLAVSKDAPAVTSDRSTTSEETENLKLAIVDAKKKTDQAVEQAANLKKENTRLTERMNDLQRSNQPATKIDAASNSKMESLAADLSFMQVDCNLTRADAKQIISNSRQRRDLLGEALKILNTLNQSDNPDVRKKAGERIAALNYIVKNIRE